MIHSLSPEMDSSGAGQTLGSTRGGGQDDGSYTLTPSNNSMLENRFFDFSAFIFFGAGSGVREGFHGMRSRIWSQMDTTRAPDLDSEIKIYK